MPDELNRVIVTGGAGYIGSVLTEKLLDSGYAVRIIDCMFFGDRGIKHLLSNENLEVINARIEDPEAVKKAVRGIDAVVHLAGFANDATCDIDPKLTRLINYESTLKLLRLSKEAGVSRFLYGSSAAVYGVGAKEALAEDSEPNPVSLYAKYRVKCEEAVLKYDSKDIDTCCMRKSTVFGFSKRQRLDLAVNAMTASAVNRHELTLIGGNQWRPNLHVADAAEAYIAALEAPPDRIKGEVFNVGANSTNHTIEEIAEMVAGAVPNTKIIRKPLADSVSYNLSFDKLNKVLRFNAGRSVAQGIRELSDAFKKGLIPNYEDDIYYNLKQMLKMKSKGLFA